MVDYIKRKDAINAFDDPRVEWNYGDVSPSSVIDVIKTIPAADVVKVVLCKDCQWYDASDSRCDLYGNRHFDGFYCHDGGSRTDK